MRDFQPKLKRIIERLPLAMQSEHFLIRYGLRNPACGRGLGSSGVEDRGLLLTYVHALERLYQAMTSPPWSRPAPKVGGDGKITIYVFDISELIPGDASPFTHVTSEGVPFICLPPRSVEPSSQAETLRAASEAVHEATHIFNFCEQLQRPADSFLWHWFDEAIAVFMETHLIPGNHDHFRFLKNWIDIPETPLDDWAARYQAGMFVCYLEKKHPGFANRVWMGARSKEGPIDTLRRMIPEIGKQFVSADPDERDFFASGYCLDSYFLWDQTSDTLAPELFIRFGGRAVTETFLVRPEEKPQVSGGHRLNHLACRYFRFYLKGGIERLRVEIRAEDGQVIAPLKAELAGVNAEMQRSKPFVPLRPLQSVESSATTFAAEVGRADFDGLDHLVLVVTNCGMRPARVNDRIEHDDDRRFEITVSAG